jgi:hypothetical protein
MRLVCILITIAIIRADIRGRECQEDITRPVHLDCPGSAQPNGTRLAKRFN